MATVAGILNFGVKGNVSTTASLSYPGMTANTVVTNIEYTNKLEEVLIQDMRVREIARTVGVGMTIMGFAPMRAVGSYAVRAVIKEA